MLECQSSTYVPDRIKRYTGEASPLDPCDDSEDEQELVTVQPDDE